ncbi:hypothetical protein FACS1894211_11680 [Clostridia bacterium]|nr:hypothetical protein FACS1894211_11680 [Clostridia bacterium]
MDGFARKAINFDLDTNEMRKIFKRYTDGYRLLRKSFKKLGFEHEQGSGYISKKEISNVQAERAIRALAKQNPWLLKCVKKFKITEPAVLYEGEFVLADIAAIKQPKISVKSKPTAMTQDEKQQRDRAADKNAAIERMTETLKQKYVAQGMSPEDAGKRAAQRAADWHNGNVPVPPKKPQPKTQKEIPAKKKPSDYKGK